MKKIVSIIALIALTLTMFVACGEPKEKDYTLAIGVAVTQNLESSKFTQTVASVVVDANGKIVACDFDCVDYTAYKNDAVVTNAPASKATLGDNYMMPAGSWATQSEKLAEHIVGMTKDEVAAIALGDDGKATDTDLKASCSFDISDLIAAVGKAFASEHKIAFKSSAASFTTGLSVVSSAKDTSKEATDETPATTNVKLTVTYAGVVLADGAVVAGILDTAEPEFKNFNAEGVAESISYKGTKREQGESYDAYSPMPAGTWYVQADAYAKAAIGLTKDNVSTLASEGVAGCTIGVTEYKAAIEAAVKAAK